MTDDLPQFAIPAQKPTRDRPLLGATVLVVEDSRFASEAVRLLCLRSGARIRRADTLASAHRHLQVYRPTAVIVDLGLPDGSGLELIAELDHSDTRVPVLLGTSGDPASEDEALEAGADGFIQKPITSLAEFQQAILTRLPEAAHPVGPRAMSSDVVAPDPLALRDDLAHVADVLSTGEEDPDMLDYVAQFLGSVAQCASDAPLAAAARGLATARAAGQRGFPEAAVISKLVANRLEGNIAL
ncbi:response regulator [Vannielia litorea]|uniref:response regulator n=1 Tax=Vannielia TaxID=2813041 RepID=UPI001C989E21|nr:response regulator [Vannielia litorea]MBY6048407.1 response regulator [Vannielia litorea]MBY6075821.1 response regulator [Vannielia litorea]MBY6151692.1 response regulator [Vannielia litorea]